MRRPRHSRRPLILVLVAMAAASLGAKRPQKGEGTPRPALSPTVSRTTFSGGSVTRAVLHGRILDWSEGHDSLDLLVDEGESHPLRRLDVAQGTMETLEPDAGAASLLLRGTALEKVALGGVVLDRSGMATAVPGRLCVATVGALLCVAPGQAPTRLALPVKAEHMVAGLAIRSPRVRTVGRVGGDVLLAAGPDPVGKRRLRTVLLDPLAGSSRECWSQLPGDEEVLQSDYAVLDGKPILAVTTHPAGKLGLFSDRLLRVFVLETDPQRLGTKPFLAVKSGQHLWQQATVRVLDADGDGHDDLLFGYWKGLTSTHAQVDAYLGDGKGGLKDSPRESEITPKEAERGWMEFAHDFDGDGIPDLAFLSNDGVEVHRGRRDPKGKNLYEEQIWRSTGAIEDLPHGNYSLNIGGSGAEVQTDVRSPVSLADLGGGAVPDLVFVGNSAGMAIVAVVRFANAGMIGK